MRKRRLTSFELLERLIPVGALDREGLDLYRALLAEADERAVREGAVRLLERLCEMGRIERVGREEADGRVRLSYRDLASLDTISITLAQVEQTEPSVPEPPAGEPSAAAKPLAPSAPPALPLALLDAVAASSRRSDLVGALDRLYDLLHEAVGYDRIAVFMSRGLSNSSARTLSELDDVYRWPDEERITPDPLKAEVEESGRSLHVPDVQADERHARCFPHGVGGSLVVAPLKAEAYVYGVLELWTERPEAYGPEDLFIIEFIAEFAGGLIKRRLEVEELIFVDHMSEIHNRRYFDEQLTREIERCKRSGNALALLVMDLDDFKQINDTLGHAAGDSVLRQVARILTENARQVDIVARYGGEEFVLVLPDVTRETARMVAERVRSNVETQRFVTGLSDDPTRDVTISIGGALYPLDAKSRSDLIDKADRIALFEAKRTGKNRTVFWKDIRQE